MQRLENQFEAKRGCDSGAPAYLRLEDAKIAPMACLWFESPETAKVSKRLIRRGRRWHLDSFRRRSIESSDLVSREGLSFLEIVRTGAFSKGKADITVPPKGRQVAAVGLRHLFISARTQKPKLSALLFCHIFGSALRCTIDASKRDLGTVLSPSNCDALVNQMAILQYRD